ncbi:MAG: hypothetical protein WCQ60_01200 [bacterium]
MKRSIALSVSLLLSAHSFCTLTRAEETRSQPEPSVSLSVTNAPKLSLTPSDEWLHLASYKKVQAACIVIPTNTSAVIAVSHTNAVVIEVVNNFSVSHLYLTRESPINDGLTDFTDPVSMTDRNYLALQYELHKRAYVVGLIWYSPAEGLGMDYSNSVSIALKVKKTLDARVCLKF